MAHAEPDHPDSPSNNFEVDVRAFRTPCVPDTVREVPDDPYPPKIFVGPDVFTIEAVSVPEISAYYRDADELRDMVFDFFGHEIQFGY